MINRKTLVSLTLLVFLLTNPGHSSPSCPSSPKCIVAGPSCVCNSQCCSTNCALLISDKDRNCADRLCRGIDDFCENHRQCCSGDCRHTHSDNYKQCKM
ncbi:unnamed protein product [Allacma fusca]|uniref:Uncharacterized protein n=1 Tax=Allacma fusca TaxID=39272 RepID=A0A8J2KV14_9HEXA|nr:unnamed protein product [Allacma fusca]